LAVVISFAITFGSTNVSLNYETTGMDQPFTKSSSESSCDNIWPGKDQLKDIYGYDLGGSYSAWVQLCFRGLGRGGDFSINDHDEYTKTRTKAFVLPADDLLVARAKARSLRYHAVIDGAIYAICSSIAVWIILSCVQRMIGWVARGFLGIPRGQDRRCSQL
jgi:hypothetical protein